MPRKRQAPSAMAADLSSELVRVATLPIHEARSQWLVLTGRPPSTDLSGDLIRRMIAYRLQQQALGGLDRKLAGMLDRLADGAPMSRLRPGCVLVREHGGMLHQVIVLRSGFAWNGQTLPSLSAVAKAITGTAWNGHRFFGLKHGGAAATAGDRQPRAIQSKAKVPADRCDMDDGAVSPVPSAIAGASAPRSPRRPPVRARTSSAVTTQAVVAAELPREARRTARTQPEWRRHSHESGPAQAAALCHLHPQVDRA